MMMSVELDQAKRETNAELQTMYPDSIRRCSPKSGYVRDPKSTDGLVVREFEVDVKVKTVVDGFCATEIRKDTVSRWCRLEPFATSQSQIVKYMKLKGHPVPKKMKETDIEGNPKDSTEKKELERLYVKTGDPFYSKIVEYREYDKMKGTYVDGFLPSKDGCVHTTFTFAPATGQLSSRNPNIQNIPIHSQNERQERLIHQFRRMIVAKPGHHIVEFDYKSFHALTTGFEAQDADYIRAARLDIHSFLGAFVLKLPGCDHFFQMPDDELQDRLKWVKKNYKHDRDFKWKRAMLGYGFGMGYRKCFQINREAFKNEGEAKHIFDTLNGIFPKAAKWRDSICEIAHRQTYLISRYKFIRWFFDVFHWDAKRRKMTHGDDHEAAIAFLPANDAFGHIRDAMRSLDDQGWTKQAQLINNVHDSLLFHMPDSIMDDAVPAIYNVMTAPSSVLVDPVVAPQGLYVDVEAKIGLNWENTEELKISTVA